MDANIDFANTGTKVNFDPTSGDGYALVMADPALQLCHQDQLDSFFGERVVAVRNSLQDSGWIGVPRALSLQSPDGSFAATFKPVQVAGGCNVVGGTWKILLGQSTWKAVAEIADDLTKTAAQLAGEIGLRALEKAVARIFNQASPDKHTAGSPVDVLLQLKATAVASHGKLLAFNEECRCRTRDENADEIKQFSELSHKALDARKALAGGLAAIPDDGFSVRGTTRDGWQLYLNQSARKAGAWQLTRFDTKGDPFGDTNYPEKEAGIWEFLREADLWTVSGVGDFDLVGGMKCEVYGRVESTKAGKEVMEITLYDTSNNSCAFEYRQSKIGNFDSTNIYQDAEFGKDGQTESAEIDGVVISGNLWRFLEGTFGVDTLFERLRLDAETDKENIIECFQGPFSKTANDAEALVVWTKLVAARSMAVEVEGSFSGKVLSVADGIVTQKTNRDGSTVLHDLRVLSEPVVAGQVVEIAYSGGVGVVGWGQSIVFLKNRGPARGAGRRT